MKLYGTKTSPFVRRVRIVAELVGAECELVDTSQPEGQAALRKISPIWKVPAAEVEGEVILDSHVIIDHLLDAYGTRNVRPIGAGFREKNLINVIDGALDSAINVFYLKKDGADVEKIDYLVKQRARVANAMTYVEKELRGVYLTDVAKVGLAEIALLTALDWMAFRSAYPVERHPGLVRFREAHPFASTAPVA